MNKVFVSDKEVDILTSAFINDEKIIDQNGRGNIIVKEISDGYCVVKYENGEEEMCLNSVFKGLI
ncbi:MAG: hypothetical protein WCT22_05070 [Patescibacteria group bacterium]|jgi:hypothetical protein